MRVGETLNVEMSWERNDVDLPTRQLRHQPGADARVLLVLAARVRAEPDPVQRPRRRWTSNFRFGWLQQANTGVFLVYTDSHDLDERSFVPPTGTNRSLILKISRMFDAID